ncbi:hypothetical protein AOLI_G00241630 [Acnodon oligacanthus]
MDQFSGLSAILAYDFRSIPNLDLIIDNHTYTFLVDSVHPDTQPLFAFTFQDRQYTWYHLPQGFRDSSAVFSAVIRDALASWAPPPDCVVISYVDDILLSSTTEDQCRKGFCMLLEHLPTCGFKVSPTKLQWCKPSVTYLRLLLRIVPSGHPWVLLLLMVG